MISLPGQLRPFHRLYQGVALGLTMARGQFARRVVTLVVRCGGLAQGAGSTALLETPQDLFHFHATKWG